jgi:HAD superfamily hydrolase (TIGR01662 family)
VALRAVFFDVGETLVDESWYWGELARESGLRPHVVWAALGLTIARGEPHDSLWWHLGCDRPAACDVIAYRREDLYPDAVGCLETLRARGLFVGVVGNQTMAMERWAREQALPADYLASSASWGVRKPDPAFFERVVREAGCAPAEVAYVGDRVDNDVTPAAAAGLAAVHVRRGPWGALQDCSGQGAVCVESLTELPPALASLP